MSALYYVLLEHPADIGFRAYGETLPELFVNCALAMLSIAGEPDAVEARGEYPIEVESGDRESLLVDWLSEVLYWFDGKQVAFHEFRVRKFTDTMIRAVGLGEPRHEERHRAKVIVKAVTYHQLRIERCGELWCADVYLDV
jgi:SHS2 domain-containing protein